MSILPFKQVILSRVLPPLRRLVQGTLFVRNTTMELVKLAWRTGTGLPYFGRTWPKADGTVSREPASTAPDRSLAIEGQEKTGVRQTPEQQCPLKLKQPLPRPSLSSQKKPNGAELAKETRRVFHNLHLEQLKDESASSRLSRMMEPEVMGLPKDYFGGRYCADLGCGSHVFGALNLLELGAKFVHAMDVDASFIEPATQRFCSRKEFEGRWQLDVGSLMEAPYGDRTFDFVVCQGVIHHTEDPQRCLYEIVRVLKPGGKAYITVLGAGGIIQRFGLEILRDEYRKNRDFSALVDSEDVEAWFRGQLRTLKGRIDKDGSPAYEASVKLLEALEVLIDRDLILSLRDLVQAPKYVGYTEAQFGGMLTQAGFSEWYRFGKKLQYHNIRKVFAPLYFDYRDPLAKLLYNDGGTFNVVATTPSGNPGGDNRGRRMTSR